MSIKTVQFEDEEGDLYVADLYEVEGDLYVFIGARSSRRSWAGMYLEPDDFDDMVSELTELRDAMHDEMERMAGEVDKLLEDGGES